MNKLALVVVLLLLQVLVGAQPKPATGVFVAAPPASSNPIAAARLPGATTTLPNPWWSTAGAGSIPARAGTPCYTDTGGLDTAAQINAQIAACAGQAVPVVQLQSGTYTLTTGLIADGVSNVTLRGNGPDATILDFSGGNNCGGPGAVVCVKGASISDFYDSPTNAATWGSTYTHGTTTITLSLKTNLQVGSLVALQQSENTAGDTGHVYDPRIAGTTSFTSGNQPMAPDKAFHQIVTVTSIEGGSCAPSCDIGITPPIYLPTWASGLSPVAWWGNVLPSTGVGIEAVTIDSTDVATENAIMFYHASHGWVQNVRSIKPESHHVKVFIAHHITVRDSYFFDGQNHAAESYGINALGGYDNLVENNIFQFISVPMMNEGSSGSVYAYNYAINNLYSDGTFQQAAMYQHASGNTYLLWEGNDTQGFTADNYHGASFFVTALRNRISGKDGPTVTTQTVPVFIYSFSRLHNLLGNVLGDNSYHTNYQKRAGTDSENLTTCQHSIFSIGWGANCESDDVGGDDFPNNDATATSSLFRWGNYDTVNDAARWESSEVPSGISNFSNPVPGSQTVPSSLYLSAAPSFFGSVAWPPIGPDVTCSSTCEANIGSHAERIPAKYCFVAVMGGAFGDTTAKTFNADACYPVP